MTDTTRAMLLAHQIDATTELKALLKLAAVKHLPPLEWSISQFGILLGRAIQSDRADQRAAVEEWAAALHHDAVEETAPAATTLSVQHAYQRGPHVITIEAIWET